MTDDCFVYTSNEKGFIIGDGSQKYENNVVKLSNGIKSEYVNTIEAIIVPRTHNSIKIYRLEYRCFSKLPKLKKAFVPNTITELGGDTFLYCYSLESVVFEENMKLKSLSYYTFRYTNLTFIDIPSSIIELREYTFARIPNLQVIYVHSYIKKISSYLFNNTNTANLKIFAPKDYPNATILGLPILKVLNSYKKQKTKCLCKTLNQRYIIIINILLCA